MTLTVPNTDKQIDQEVPGGGTRTPVTHRVRIVVVPLAPHSIAAHASHDAGHRHRLTDDEASAVEKTLRAAEDVLKGMASPPDSTGPTGVSDPTGPENMFEALEPTDIVVVGRNAASVLTVDDSGKPVSATKKPMSANATTQASQTTSDAKRTRKLFLHDDRNRHTVLPVWTGSDTIEYRCDQEFEIVEVKQAGWKIFGAPEDPFVQRKRPYVSKQGKRDGQQMWIWTSGILPASANNQQYKMTFKINGEPVDPDVICGDPPPEP